MKAKYINSFFFIVIKFKKLITRILYYISDLKIPSAPGIGKIFKWLSVLIPFNDHPSMASYNFHLWISRNEPGRCVFELQNRIRGHVQSSRKLISSWPGVIFPLASPVKHGVSYWYCISKNSHLHSSPNLCKAFGPHQPVHPGITKYRKISAGVCGIYSPAAWACWHQILAQWNL